MKSRLHHALITLSLFLVAINLHAQVTFNLASSPVVGNGPSSVVAADVNGDGKIDLISANIYDNTLTVLTNNGAGGFVTAATLVGFFNPLYPSLADAVIAADVNGDGKLDLICANAGSQRLSVLTNNGTGGFALEASPIVGVNPVSVAAADVNRDGKMDLISADYDSSGGMTVLTNNDTGGFVIASQPVVGLHTTSVTAADVNGDGKVDLISANILLPGLIVLTNDGGGGFVTAATLSGISYPYSVKAADVNGDGKLDLICANASSQTLSVLTNNGTGSFVLEASPVVGVDSQSVTAADVNGDGKVDLISANEGAHTLTVLTNNGSGGFVTAATLDVGLYAFSVTVADVNGDGRVDLISANSEGNTLSVLTNSTVFPPPLITVPINITVEATSALGAIVSFSTSATNLEGGTVTTTNTPASGSTFPLGTNTVTVTATWTGSTTNKAFTITVHDTTPPTITVPVNITVEATSPVGAIANFTPTAFDLVDGSVTVQSAPVSGSTFALGTNTVNCTTTDSHGNIGNTSFKVVVRDTTAPVLTLSSNLSVEATSPAGAVANFTCSATDLVDGSVTVLSTPTSGSTFVLGTNTVNCSATDSHGNTSSGSFTVAVRDTTRPVITLLGDNPMTIVVQTPFVDPGATASDIYAGDLTGAIVFGGTVNPNIAGNYTLTYSVNDGNGNSTTTTRTVVVSTPPLHIASAGNQSVLFWSGSATNYILQSTTNLAAPNWETVSDAVPVIAFTVTNTSPVRFFRILAP